VIALLAPEALAQACICSRNVALPSGAVSRAWEGAVALDYGLSLSGDGDAWRGFSVTDRHGDSMAGMFMPPHLVQTASLGMTLGLPAGFSASATLPWMDVHHIGHSEMPGDVDSRSLADTSLLLGWGHLFEDGKTFVGGSVGATLPTGKVVPDTPVRAGKGAVGALVGVVVTRKAGPKVGLALSMAASPTLFTPPDGYRVGSGGNVALGARWSPRENGRVNFSLFGIGQHLGTDREEFLVYKNTGYLSADLALGANWNFWAKELRSATLSVRGQLPLWQVVGDPMYAENFAVGGGVSAVIF